MKTTRLIPSCPTHLIGSHCCVHCWCRRPRPSCLDPCIGHAGGYRRDWLLLPSPWLAAPCCSLRSLLLYNTSCEVRSIYYLYSCRLVFRREQAVSKFRTTKKPDRPRRTFPSCSLPPLFLYAPTNVFCYFTGSSPYSTQTAGGLRCSAGAGGAGGGAGGLCNLENNIFLPLVACSAAASCTRIIVLLFQKTCEPLPSTGLHTNQ